MDRYVKQLLAEIKEKHTALKNRRTKLIEASQKIFANTLDHATKYEQYYQLIKNTDEEKVSPGQLPFAVYSQPETKKSSKENDNDSEEIQNILDDAKKVFLRSLQTLKSETITVEQLTDEFVELIKDFHEYYEDLIEEVKF